MGIIIIPIFALMVATALLYLQRDKSPWLRWAFVVPGILAIGSTMYIVMSFNGGY